MKRKIIITVDCDLTDEQAIDRVHTVIKGGRVTSGKYGPHYCGATKFSDGVMVCVNMKRKIGGADSFVVYRS